MCSHCKKNREHYKSGLCLFCYKDLYDEKPNLPQVVNQDFINELKMRGKENEVKKLLKTFHNHVRKEKHTELKYFNSRLRKVKKVQGYCSILWCNNKTDGKFALCKRCRKKHREYTKRHKK